MPTDPPDATVAGDRPARVLMVCSGNICRSPAMEYYARRAWGEAAEVSSAGTWAETGFDATREMRAAAARHDLTWPRHRPTQLDAGAIARADLILVATQQHADWITRHATGPTAHVFGLLQAAELAERGIAAQGDGAARRLRDAARVLAAENHARPAPLASLEDPWGKSQATHDRVMDEIVSAIDAIGAALRVGEATERESAVDALDER